MMRCIKIIEQIWEKTQFKYLDKGVDILVYIIADTKPSIKPLKTGIAIDDKSSSALICIWGLRRTFEVLNFCCILLHSATN